MTSRLVLVGGTTGSGKTTVARTLAGDLGAGWLQLNTVWIAMKAAGGHGTPACGPTAPPPNSGIPGPDPFALHARPIRCSFVVRAPNIRSRRTSWMSRLV